MLAVKGSGGDIGSIMESGFGILYLADLQHLKKLYSGEKHEDDRAVTSSKDRPALPTSKWNLHSRLRTALIAIGAAIGLSAVARASDSGFKLTFDRPATKWTEALPLGNGRIGAMVFGGIDDERLQINESTLWGGRAHDYTNPEAYLHLSEIRELIFAGKVDDAEKFSEDLMGKPKLLMPYQPFCDVQLHFPGHGRAKEYRRELHLDDAIAETRYKIGSANFRREIFASFPDQVLVIRLTASQPGQLTFSIGMDSPQAGTHLESTANDTLRLTGQIQPRQNPPSSWTGSWDQPGIHFAAVLKVLPEGGSVRNSEGRLEISNANSVTILFTNATSFKNYRDISGDALEAARAYLVQIPSGTPTVWLRAASRRLANHGLRAYSQRRVSVTR